MEKVKLLGILFNEKCFDLKEIEMTNNSSCLFKFNYCPIIWHFCGNVDKKKIENVQMRTL